MVRTNSPVILECCNCGGCPCCPGWPLEASGIIHWTTFVLESNDCEPAPSTVSLDGDFGCPGDPNDPDGTILRTASTELRVRVFCLVTDGVAEWHVQYRSAITGGGFETPSSPEWADVDYDLSCPDCGDAENGSAFGSIHFIATMACEISGPTIVMYEVDVMGIIEIGCLGGEE